MRGVIAAHVTELNQALTIAPQTNEVGRAAALLAGLFDVVAATGLRRIRLLEMGASAGLNLLLDRYHFQGRDWSFGPVESPVQVIGAIEGPVRPEPFEIVVRGGCDLHPVDAGTAAGRLLLTSFVWPFDLDRHVRLASALALAAAHPLHIDQTAARLAAQGLGDSGPGYPSRGMALHYAAVLGADRTRGRRGRLESLRRRAPAGRGEHGVRPEWSARCQA
jgi:hypothetical protein